MKMSEESFWNSSLAKILELINIHINLLQGKQKEETLVTSMRDIEGW
ncbi:hypothetical protein [uncultured Clostridium sp.]|nr:hypothetical protein [uncultured Clostridium sp.]